MYLSDLSFSARVMNRRLPSLNGAGPKSKGGPLPPIRPKESVGVIDTLDSSSKPSALPSLPAVPRPPPPSDARPKKGTKEARRNRRVRLPLAPLQTGLPAPSGSDGIKTSSPLVLEKNAPKLVPAPPPARPCLLPASRPGKREAEEGEEFQPGSVRGCLRTSVHAALGAAETVLPQLAASSCKEEVLQRKKKKKEKNLQLDSRPNNPGNILPPVARPSNPVAKPVVKPRSPVMMCPPSEDRPGNTARPPSRRTPCHPVGTAKPDVQPSSSTLCSSQPGLSQSSSPLLVLGELGLDLPNACFNNVMLLSMPESGQAVAAAPAKEVSPIPSPKPVVTTGPLLTRRAEKNAPKLVPAPPPARSCLLPALGSQGSAKRRKVKKKVQFSNQGLSGAAMLP